MTEHAICSDCSFQDLYLDQLARQNMSTNHQCSVCEKRPAAPLESLAEHIGNTVSQQLRRESDEETYFYTRHGDGPKGDELQAVLQELGCDHPWSIYLAEALCEFDYCWSSNVEGFFDSEGTYFTERVSTESVEDAWTRFVGIAQSGPRYFNKKIREFLDDLFNSVLSVPQEFAPWDVILDSSSLIYRGRVFDDMAEMREAMAAPDKLMGAPPSALAKGLRMNAPGSPIFYGAENKETVLSELRPAIDSWVLVCGFRPITALRILDLGSLELAEEHSPRPTSYFNPTAVKRLQHLRFLTFLSNRLTRPVAPRREDVDYRPTQMIANYIENVLGYDGLKWKSAQNTGGHNIGLFARSAKISPCHGHGEKLSSDNIVEFYDEDDVELIEFRIKRIKNKSSTKVPEFMQSIPIAVLNASLRADLNEIEVAQVTKATYTTNAYSVEFDDSEPCVETDTAF